MAVDSVAPIAVDSAAPVEALETVHPPAVVSAVLVQTLKTLAVASARHQLAPRSLGAVLMVMMVALPLPTMSKKKQQIPQLRKRLQTMKPRKKRPYRVLMRSSKHLRQLATMESEQGLC